jgi:DNA-binding transcriptional MocR family regulator
MTDISSMGTDLLSHPFRDGSAAGLLEEISFLIRSGALPPGTRLPIIRDVAMRLDCSPTLIANVWTRLRTVGLIETHRRGGSFVTDIVNANPPSGSGAMPLDLSNSIADRALLPLLGAAFDHALARPRLHAPSSEDITDALREAATATWPYVPEAMMAMDDGPEASILILAAFVQPGEQVAIEEPCNPRILSDMRRLGLHPVGVGSDEEGPCPQALKQILQSGIRLLVLQPRTSIPTGRSISRKRLAELAEVVSAQEGKVTVYEDDNYGILSATAPQSLGEFLPHRVLVLRSYSKPFGFDMKISVLAGASALLDELRGMKTFTGGRTSRIFQDALAYLLSDPDYALHVEKARSSYLARMKQFRRAAGEYGLEVVSQNDGLTACISVNDEQAVLLAMAAKGYLLGSGSHCTISRKEDSFVRVGLGNLPLHAIPSFVEALANVVKRKSNEIVA